MPKKKKSIMDEGFFGVASKNAKKYDAGKSKSGTVKAGLRTFVETPIEGVKQGLRKRKNAGVCSVCHGKKKSK